MMSARMRHCLVFASVAVWAQAASADFGRSSGRFDFNSDPVKARKAATMTVVSTVPPLEAPVLENIASVCLVGVFRDFSRGVSGVRGRYTTILRALDVDAGTSEVLGTWSNTFKTDRSGWVEIRTGLDELLFTGDFSQTEFLLVSHEIKFTNGKKIERSTALCDILVDDTIFEP